MDDFIEKAPETSILNALGTLMRKKIFIDFRILTIQTGV
jgi:hypothetical protein